MLLGPQTLATFDKSKTTAKFFTTQNCQAKRQQKKTGVEDTGFLLIAV